MVEERLEESINDDWQRRVLCSDGNCIGVIGPDGRCKECGKPSDEPIREIISEELGSETTVDDDTGTADNPLPPEEPAG